MDNKAYEIIGDFSVHLLSHVLVSGVHFSFLGTSFKGNIKRHFWSGIQMNKCKIIIHEYTFWNLLVAFSGVFFFFFFFLLGSRCSQLWLGCQLLLYSQGFLLVCAVTNSGDTCPAFNCSHWRIEIIFSFLSCLFDLNWLEMWINWISSCISVRNKQRMLRLCAVLLAYSLNTLKIIKWPSVEQAFTQPITPLPVELFSSGQCAKQLWKRPHVCSLIEGPLRNVLSYSSHFYQKYRNTHPFLSCKIGSPPTMTWWSSSGSS